MPESSLTSDQLKIENNDNSDTFIDLDCTASSPEIVVRKEITAGNEEIIWVTSNSVYSNEVNGRSFDLGRNRLEIEHGSDGVQLDVESLIITYDDYPYIQLDDRNTGKTWTIKNENQNLSFVCS